MEPFRTDNIEFYTTTKDSAGINQHTITVWELKLFLCSLGSLEDTYPYISMSYLVTRNASSVTLRKNRVRSTPSPPCGMLSGSLASNRCMTLACARQIITQNIYNSPIAFFTLQRRYYYKQKTIRPPRTSQPGTGTTQD